MGLQNCTIEDGATQGECNFNSAVKTVMVAKGSSDQFVELTVEDTTNNKLELYKDVEDFNQGYKFVFKGKGVTKDSASLVNDGEYEFKWKNESNTKIGYLVKKDPQ